MTYPIIIPIRGFKTSMSRLRKDIDHEIVNNVVFELLENTLNALSDYQNDVVIVTSDPVIQNKYSHFNVLLDDGTNLNTALYNATNTLDYDKFFLVMPDLPLITKHEVRKIMRLSNIFEYLIVPSNDNGTAVCCIPKEYFCLNLFGENSSKKIIQMSNNDDLKIAKLKSNKLELDIDTLSDYENWKLLLREEIITPN